MAKRREIISNEEFEKYYNNTKVKKIINYRTNFYSKSLDENERSSAGMMALYRCLQYHKENKGQQLTTNLWKFLKFELQRELKKKEKHKKLNKLDVELDLIPKKEESDVLLSIEQQISEVNYYIDKFLPKKVGFAIKGYYLNKMSIDKISEINEWTQEKTRRSIKLGISRLREIFDVV